MTGVQTCALPIFRPAVSDSFPVPGNGLCHALRRVVRSAYFSFRPCQKVGDVLPAAATDVENILLTGRSDTFVDAPESHFIMAVVHPRKHHFSPEIVFRSAAIAYELLEQSHSSIQQLKEQEITRSLGLVFAVFLSVGLLTIAFFSQYEEMCGNDEGYHDE